MSADALVEELKIRARVRLNTARREGRAGASMLRDQLHAAAREIGFSDWEHARLVLSGRAEPGDDQGSFWHAPRTGMLLHIWCSSHAEALALQARQPGDFLLPYRRQCFIVKTPFITALGLDVADAAWSDIGYDLVAGYGSPAWCRLAWQRLRSPLSGF